MGGITRAIGRLFGAPKAPKTTTVLETADEEEKAVLPVEDDENIRKAQIEREKEARGRKGRSYTREPGRSLGSLPTTLG
ncbi:MAG: hypothetical protein GOVbin52_53 [Prokaryotic dsDNA virus sp.]|nr:MAG: hypothetical protein GOVbin52_53 [Prokaryotic dsDNA virus sp.]HBX95005.1 hypothetical protein [Hyphomonas sp.]|tara:strand:+ start:11817 stop:12053 length:237 start_codon:yes stop_codon:yes gene_type:complete